MHAQLFIDPRIRDYVFIPLVLLMAFIQLLRIHGIKMMNEPKNALLDPVKVSFKTLQGTIFQDDADADRELPEGQIDIGECLKNIEPNVRET